MRTIVLILISSIFAASAGWFAYDAVEGPNLIPNMTAKLTVPEMQTMSTENAEMQIMSTSWFDRVRDLETVTENHSQQLVQGQEYMNAVNAALQRYNMYIYGTFSEDPQENLRKMEQWVLDIRNEMKQTKDRLTATEDVQEELLILRQAVEDLTIRVETLESN